MSIAYEIHEWLRLVNPGEEVTTVMMRELVPEATAGAVASALAAFSLCDPPLLELVARRRSHEKGGVMYVYQRTDIPIKKSRFRRKPVNGHGTTPGHKRHVLRGADLPLEDENPPSAMKGAGS